MIKIKSLIVPVTLIVVLILAVAVFFYQFPADPAGEQPRKEKIGIGIIASDEKIIAQYQALTDYLNQYSDDNWYLVPLRDYGSYLSQLESKQIKAAFAGSTAGYRMIKENIAVPVARGEVDGVSTYHSYVFTRRDSGLNSIAHLKDKRFAYVDVNTSAGYIYPVYLIKSKGYDPENFFRVASFLGTHENAINAVLEEKFDGGAAKDSAWKKMASQNPDLDKELQIIATSGDFPEQTFMISTDFGSEEKNELRELLLGMSDSEEGRLYLEKMGLDRFIATTSKDFGEVKNIINF